VARRTVARCALARLSGRQPGADGRSRRARPAGCAEPSRGQGPGPPPDAVPASPVVGSGLRSFSGILSL